MSNYFERLKSKWNVQSNFQLLIICVVFAITGSASLWVSKPVLNWVGLNDDVRPIIRIPLRILMIFPVYQVMLIIVGTLFGQQAFFLGLMKKWWRIKDRNKN